MTAITNTLLSLMILGTSDMHVAPDSNIPMCQDIVEVKCALLLRGQALSHQIEDVEVVLVWSRSDQTRLLQHVRVHTGFNTK